MCILGADNSRRKRLKGPAGLLRAICAGTDLGGLCIKAGPEALTTDATLGSPAGRWPDHSRR